MSNLSNLNLSFIGCLALFACSSEDTPAPPSDDDGGTKTESTGGQNAMTETGTGGEAPAGTGGSVYFVPDPNASMGGAPSLDPVDCYGPAVGDQPLIDDVDDLDKFVLDHEDRNGWWEAFDDENGTFVGKIDFTPGEGQGVDGSGGRCVDVSGMNGWGAVISVNMGYPRCMYDASVYAGICFQAKGAFTQGDHLDFSVNTADTLGRPDGGRCDATTDAENCEKFWHYKTQMRGEGAEDAAEGETVLTDEYQEFCYTWEDLKQDAEAPTPRPFKVEEIVQFEWKWPGGWPTEELDDKGKPVAGSTDASLCLDNVRFMTTDEVNQEETP